jgi:RimJ/RimL family protein N-acetyltransferase
MTTGVRDEIARGSLTVLRAKRLGDAPNDYRWRTQAELSRYDAARPITTNYQEYLALYREELLYPNPHRRSLAIEDMAERHIGNVMYYNIDATKREAELGITIGEQDYWGRGYGSEAVRLLLGHLWSDVGILRVHLKTLAWNERAQRAFANAGFREYGRVSRGGYSFVLMETRRHWEEDP